MRTLLFISYFFLTNCCYANEIDKLTDYVEVQHFLVKYISKDFKNEALFKRASYKPDTSNFEKREFTKIDIDKNGLTDLIIHGLKTFVIFDNGNDGYSLRYLDRGTFQMDKAKLIIIDTSLGLCKLIIQQHIKNDKDHDTLVYKFRSFIEYNSTVDNNFKMESIKFKTSGCFGTCPIFEMTVNFDKSATYNAIQYNEEKGKYYGLIIEEEFKELTEILKYINLDRLENSYNVNWTDDQSASLEIMYNGKTKTINDYGEIGTFGLSRLYSKFFSWRKKIGWSE
jgi:hypothetical protein